MKGNVVKYIIIIITIITPFFKWTSIILAAARETSSTVNPSKSGRFCSIDNRPDKMRKVELVGFDNRPNR